MGISGLLPQLKSVTSRIHLSQLKGKVVAVDAYCLLHKGAYSCARELVEGYVTDKYIWYCVQRIEALKHAGMEPYVVFDGGPLPSKGEEEESRSKGRRENAEKARALWRQGSTTAAMEYYQRAVDITPEIAHRLVQELERRKIRFVVAPYEADAQCAYLAKCGVVDVVMTEDSDLLAYGCAAVLYKVDAEGTGDYIQFCDLPHCRELSFVGWNLELFQEMCVMAGCDFVKALPGIGIKKAHAHIRRTRSIARALRALKFDGVAVPEGYEEKVQKALWTFKHQRVYCPEKMCLVHLHDIPSLGLAGSAKVGNIAGDATTDFLGEDIPPMIAQGIATGALNPVTHTPFETTGPGRLNASTSSREEPSRGSTAGQRSSALNTSLTSMMQNPSRNTSFRGSCMESSVRDGSLHTGNYRQNSSHASFINGSRKRPRPVLRPLKSLKDILNRALTSNSEDNRELSPSIHQGLGDDHADDDACVEETNVEEMSLFTPLCRPKGCSSSPQEGEVRDNASHPQWDLQETMHTPGIYLSDLDIMESPENIVPNFGMFGCTVTSPPRSSAAVASTKRKIGSTPLVDHIPHVTKESARAVEMVIAKSSRVPATGRRKKKSVSSCVETRLQHQIDTTNATPKEKSAFDRFALPVRR